MNGAREEGIPQGLKPSSNRPDKRPEPEGSGYLEAKTTATDSRALTRDTPPFRTPPGVCHLVLWRREAISHNVGGNRLRRSWIACPIFLGVEESGWFDGRRLGLAKGSPQEN
jgi:hypothetical protein